MVELGLGSFLPHVLTAPLRKVKKTTFLEFKNAYEIKVKQFYTNYNKEFKKQMSYDDHLRKWPWFVYDWDCDAFVRKRKKCKPGQSPEWSLNRSAVEFLDKMWVFCCMS